MQADGVWAASTITFVVVFRVLRKYWKWDGTDNYRKAITAI